ncbi:MAG TPA: ATP-binding protein, partial [Caldilineaceae bacterium]|nr:ATP-binding protein [Caldilineaceae bacterium]
SLPHVYGDGAQVEQALVNLCINAIQALDGSGTIRLTACLAPESEHTLLLRVADDGPGIPPEQQSRIFAPFFSTKDRGRPEPQCCPTHRDGARGPDLG